MKNIKIIYVLIALILAGSTWYIFTPHNFEDCVLSNMKGATSESAANNIRAACKAKFPAQIVPTTDVIADKPLVIMAPLNVETSFLGIELGDNADTVTYKKGKDFEDNKDTSTTLMRSYKKEGMTIYFDKTDGKALRIQFTCNYFDRFDNGSKTRQSETSLSGVRCNASDRDLYSRFAGKTKLYCFEGRPEIRAIRVADLNVSFLLQKEIVVEMMVEKTPSRYFIDCPK